MKGGCRVDDERENERGQNSIETYSSLSRHSRRYTESNTDLESVPEAHESSTILSTPNLSDHRHLDSTMCAGIEDANKEKGDIFAHRQKNLCITGRSQSSKVGGHLWAQLLPAQSLDDTRGGMARNGGTEKTLGMRRNLRVSSMMS